ncbi:Cytochrome P450 [Penicillium angulare]|uniref:Cytochrome P450 n=1 Tax=Penicillium angulare TaxID=116970 RepID=A0A9W9K732_9EURO|nr:Cytochrome P450 [Penicillium angulare]
MLEQIANFSNLLSILAKEDSINLMPTCRALEADIVCYNDQRCRQELTGNPTARFAFGSPIGAIDSLKLGSELNIIKENDLKSSKMPLYTKFPFATRLYYHLAERIYDILGYDISLVATSRWFEQWSNQQLTTSLDSEKRNGLSFLAAMAGSRISTQSALSEAKEMLGPGTDTTSATLAHILWALSLNQSLQNTLVSELENLKWPTDMTALESIPLLVACVKEGIRWTGAAAAMLPRIVPRGGTLFDGQYLPKGVLKEYHIHPGSEFPHKADVEATLPPRREWVAAVPTGQLRVCFRSRSSATNK